MADQVAFPIDQYAFPASAGGDDDAAQSDQRNQQIQSAFDSQRFQRGMLQGVSKALNSQAAQIDRLKQQAAAKQSSSAS